MYLCIFALAMLAVVLRIHCSFEECMRSELAAKLVQSEPLLHSCTAETEAVRDKESTLSQNGTEDVWLP